MQHILLTVLGTKADKTCYALNGKHVQARLAPLALFELLPDTDLPDHVYALCTSQAREIAFPVLQEGLSDKAEVTCIDVPDIEGPSPQEGIYAFMSKVADIIAKSKCQSLSLDITHGFRHLSFLTYAIALFTSALMGLEIRGAYYGLHSDSSSVSPFLDLKPLLELPDWIHGIRVLGETGSAAAIAKILKRATDSCSREIARDLQRMSEAYLSGLPLEVGCVMRRLLREKIKPLRRILRNDHRLPLSDELISQLEAALYPLALPEDSVFPKWEKSKVQLTREELTRQARYINTLIDQNNITTALGVMREWTVSWALWQQGGECAGWLDHKTCRKKVEHALNSLRSVYGDPSTRVLLTKDQKDLAKFWKDLADLRNAYHHNGMRKEDLSNNNKINEDLQSISNYWKYLSSCPTVKLDFSDETTILVSPIGNHPGVLYSALKNSQAALNKYPDYCAVICSNSSKKAVPKVLEIAEYTGQVIYLTLDDPHAGYSEIERLITEVKQLIARSATVLVNLTGGTTLMGMAASEIAAKARALGRTVRRFALVDRRTPQEQEADPYIISESLWLDKLDSTEGFAYEYDD